MNYTVFIRPQITPATVTVHGPDGPATRPAPIPAPIYPATFVRMIWSDTSDLYGADPAKRVELWEDAAGTATAAEIFAACPGLKDWYATRIRVEGERRLKALVTPYMAAERETWHIQQAEAEAWDAQATNANIPFITALATARGITIDDLVNRIMENVNLFRAGSGTILGQQQRLLDQVYAAADVASLLAIAWGE